MGEPQVFVLKDLTAGVRTRPMLSARPPHLLVEGLDWESASRGSGLRPGDQILAVDGVSFAGLSADEISKRQNGWIGQLAEPQTWEELQRKEGDGVGLTVRRRGYPRGWETLELTGRLRAKRTYRDGDNMPTLWFGGPNDYDYSGFPTSWPAWAEAMRKLFTRTLCLGWQEPGITTRYELKTLLDEKPRVDFLVTNFPGEFANAVRADFDAAVESMRGTAYSLTDADLAYRRADEERAAEVAVLATQAWRACVEELANETVPAFPAEHPVFGNPDPLVGKHVLLERLPTRNWIAEAGHNWLVAGSDADGWYFMDAETDPAFRMFRAVRRYQGLVAPNLREEYTVLARILPDPGMLVMDGSARWGLPAEPVAALIGDALFVDLRRIDGTESPFAGEEGLLKPRTAMPPADAPPEDVLTAMITAVKAGDRTVWRSLYADWRVSRWFDDAPQIHYHTNDLREGAWEDSRRTLMERAYDARVVWIGEPYELTTGREFDGAPKVDEVEAEIEHIGQFDGEYRAFNDLTTNRGWRLQRMNGGPWRIASMQDL